MKRLLQTVYVIGLMMAAGMAIGAAARAGWLIPAAVPFALVLIGLLRLLPAPAERAGWAAFTLWLGSTYVALGSPIEIGVLVLYGGLAGLGAFRSPYLLSLAWLIHPLWDFVPRTLPPNYIDLPMACVLFDLPIGVYLLWGARARRWSISTPGLNRPRNPASQQSVF